MNLVCQPDKMKLDAWTCKTMLSFIKMKTHKKLGSVAPRSKIADHIYFFPAPCLQSCNHCDDGDVEEDVEEDEEGCGVFGSDEEDDGFDAMVQRQLSGLSESVAPTELEDDSQEPAVDSELPMDAQVLVMEDFPRDVPPTCDWWLEDAQPNEPLKGPDPMEISPPRPVARPLQASHRQADIVVDLSGDDGPTEVAEMEVKAVDRRAKRAEELRAKIMELNQPMLRSHDDSQHRPLDLVPSVGTTDKSEEVWVVQDSLPYGGDCDQTLPMHLPGDELPASIGILLKNEDVDLDKLEQAFVQDEKMKQESKGGGRGGGRGRGRGRGRASKAQPPPAPEDVPEVSADERAKKTKASSSKASSSKRAQMSTPERRKLFDSDHEKDAPDVPKKDDVQAEGATGVPASPSPVKPRKAKRVRRSQKTPKKNEKIEKPMTEDQGSSKPSVDKENPKVPEVIKDDKPQPIPPTRIHQEWADEVLARLRDDPSAAFFAKKMFDATKVPERQCDRQMEFWRFSMYWDARRVGVLQRMGPSKKKTHVTTVSGTNVCTHIGIPMSAALLWV
eukprot:Skav228643  [mRNA]  locus=scaffold5539:31121:34175:- [translate_table: standard]